MKIEKLVTDVIKSRKNANKIAEIIECIDSEKSEDLMIPAIEGSIKIFEQITENNDILFDIPSKSEMTKVIKYKLWIGERFSDCFASMLTCLLTASEENQIDILHHIMKLMQLKTCCIVQQTKEGQIKTCENDFKLLLEQLLQSDNILLLESFFEFFKYDDIRYAILKATPLVLSECAQQGQNDEKLMKTVFVMLKELAEMMPEEGDMLSNSFFLPEEVMTDVKEKNRKALQFNLNEQRKTFSKAWLEFLKQPFSMSLHKEILIVLHTLLIPNFSKPRLLADFLTRSFKAGGGLALLGLHGLFVLMNEHNLEYPDFYKNLYSLLHPRIFEKKYKARFFNLMQLFLSSTHLPTYIVAAFVKKMARLALIAPPHGILVLLGLITYLLRTHPSISFLVNSSEEAEVSEDPYMESEEDIMSCKAMQSSLWELATLANHFLPEVAKAAVAAKKPNTKNPHLDDLLETTYFDLISFDEGDFKSNAMCHVPPDKISGGFEDLTDELWEI